MKLKITITGRVHDVGYRLFPLDAADSLLINRFDVRNVVICEKQAVVILVEGEEEQINEFVKFVRSEKPEKAVVERIEVEEYTGPVRTIESCRNSLMLGQLNKIVQVGLSMLEKQEKMLEKQESLLEKQDETIKVIRGEGEKTREYLGKKIDESKEYLGEKIDALRSDLKSYLDERLRKIEKEIEAIKARIGMR